MTQPGYFDDIRHKAQERWQRVDDDEQLRTEWRQRLSHITRDPGRVISELLQNADDAGATWARVTLDEGDFRIEHNGRDFTANDLDALCELGCSTKDHLHTSDSYGMGFWTVLGLGSRVYLSTPTLSVCFDAERFAVPEPCAPDGQRTHTTIHMRISDDRRLARLSAELDRWMQDATPLLFFRNLTRLRIDDAEIEAKEVAAGPTAYSRWMTLTGHRRRILVVDSPETPLPSTALQEVCGSHGLTSLCTATCRVQILVGNRGSRLYSVVPTDVALDLPFSCNAPFVEDPVGGRITSPDLSPTNDWLLRRIGRLLRQLMIDWLGNTSLSMVERARAYTTLLPPRAPDDSIEGLSGKCVHRLLSMVHGALTREAALLTRTGLVNRVECLVVPEIFYQIWNADQIATLFGQPGQHLLAEEVSAEARQRLLASKAIEELTPLAIRQRLERHSHMPRPNSDAGLVMLWSYIVQHKYRNAWFYSSLSELAIVPVHDSDVLHRYTDTIIVTDGRHFLSEQQWQFLVSWALTIDPNWIGWLEQPPAEEVERLGLDRLHEARELMSKLHHYCAINLATLIDQTTRWVFAHEHPGSDGIRLAHIIARANLTVPDEFRYLCEDGVWRGVSDGPLLDIGPQLERQPENWSSPKFIDRCYAEGLEPQDRQAWYDWARSPKSRIWTPPLPSLCVRTFWSSDILIRICHERGCAPPSPQTYRFDTPEFHFRDYDLEGRLWYRLERVEPDYPYIWARLIAYIGRNWHAGWAEVALASFGQEDPVPATAPENGSSRRNASYRLSVLLDSASVWPVKDAKPVAAWVQRLRNTRCLPDENGRMCRPMELCRTTPATSHLRGYEQFLHDSFDRSDFYPLLDLLGVRARPNDADRIIERIRAWATAGEAPTDALYALYHDLDRTMPHLSMNARTQIATTFRQERLLPAGDGSWHTADDICRRNPQAIPGMAVLPEPLPSLALWDQLYVAAQPTLTLLITWLKSLPDRVRLSDRHVSCIADILAQAPAHIWDTVGHWLSLDGCWMPTGELSYAATQVEAGWFLFPAVRRRAADLSMLPAERRGAQPFVALPALAAAIQWEMISDEAPTETECEWLTALGRCLMRVRLPDDATTNDEDATRPTLAWKADSHRLLQTTIRRMPTLKARPMLDGEPAGPAQAREALWHGTTLTLRYSGAAAYQPMVDEVAARFPPGPLTQAIAACMDRSPGWIADYFREHFDMDPEASFRDDVVAYIVADDTSRSIRDDTMPDSYPNRETAGVRCADEYAVSFAPESDHAPAEDDRPRITDHQDNQKGDLLLRIIRRLRPVPQSVEDPR